MKNVIVTGASSGIGKSIYEYYKKEIGTKVVGISRRGPDIKLDVSDGSGVVFQKVEAQQVDMLVNAAGIMPFEEKPAVMDVNFWGVYNIIAKYERLLDRGSCVINIASVSGVRPDAELPIYAASKAAVIALTKSLALRKAEEGIRFNCISPGFYKTNLVSGDTPLELVSTIPLGWEDVPDNIVDVVLMIENAKYMTGSNIVIDGGVSL